jgi:hypothetical protein
VVAEHIEVDIWVFPVVVELMVDIKVKEFSFKFILSRKIVDDALFH